MAFKRLEYCGQHVTTGTVSGVPTTTPTNEGSEHLVIIDGKIKEYYVWSKDSNGDSKWVGGAYPDFIDVNNTAINYAPTASGNTNNRNSIVTDPAGDKWIIDANGDATKITTTFTDVKYSKLAFVDPINGNDTTGTGSDNKMFKTITKALSTTDGSGWRVVLAPGTYVESPTVQWPNTDIVTVAGSERGNTYIQGTVNFTHTSSSSGIQGIKMTNLTHSGAGALYVTDCQVDVLLNKTSTGYIEVSDSQLQGTSISTISAGTGLIRDSLIANMTISGATSGYTLKSNIIDATGTVTFAGGSVYNIQDNTGNIVTTAGVYMETALISAGLPSATAKQYMTNFSNKLAMLHPDTNNTNANMVSWNSATKRLEITSLKVAGSILAANVCVNNVVNIPNGNPLDIRTVGTGGDFADLATSLASATVVSGTVLKVLNDLTITATVNVNKAVVIDFNSKVVSSSATLPVNMFNITAGATLKNGILSHLKTTNTSVETILTINSPTSPVYVYNNTFNIQEFAIATRGQFYIGKNTFNYVGASLTNSHRFIVLYGNSGESRIYENKYTASAKQGTTRYSNFILATSTTGTAYSGKLFVNNNIQMGGDLRQFFMHEAGIPTAMELYVAHNTFNDFNGGIGFLDQSIYNGYAKIGIYSNTQGGDAVGNYKGVLFVDGAAAINENTILEYADNVQGTTALRADYVSYAIDGSTEIALKNTVTFVNKKAKVTIEQADTNLGLIVQQLKSRKTFINGATGSGTELDPYVIQASSGGVSEPSALWTTATSDPTATGNTGTLPRFVENTANGKKWYIDSTGVAKELNSTTASAPSLPVAIAIGTQAQLDALVDKTSNTYYIVTDGASNGNILIWEDTNGDGVGDIWNTYLVPTNQLEWNVLTNATGESAGTYTYDLTTDTWAKTADLEPLIPSVDDPSAVGGVKMIRRYLAPRSGSGSTYILGESVAGHGRSASHMADNGSINAPTGGETKVSKSPFTYYQTDAPFSVLSQRDAWADDAQFNQAGGVAIDDLGILYYKGTAAFLTAITGSDTGISTSISSALIPDKFWANKSVKVVKYWLSYNSNNIIAHCGDGTIWVRGVAGTAGIYGDGIVVPDKVWHKVNLPQKPWKKIYITYDGLACGALAADGTFYVWGSNTTRRIAGTTTAVYSTPFQVTGIGSISDFAMDSNSVMVIANGVRWGIGTNNAGKLGSGNTTSITSYTQLPSNGFTFDKVFSMDDGVFDSYYYITTDKKAVHTGNNALNFASSPAAATVIIPTLMGNGVYQGSVVDIRAYTIASLIQTNQGEVWTCVNASGSNNGAHGWGINTVGGVGLNVFKKVPIPSLVVGVQSSESTSFQPQFTVLTDRGCIYTWGSSDFQYDNAVGFAPGEVQISQFRQQTPKSNIQLDLLSLTASLSSVSNGSAASIFDGGTNQEITFTVQYSGTPGVLSTTGWTITGADVVVTNIQPIIYVVATSGFITFTANVTSTDIPSLVIPNTQAQNYTLNTGSLTTSISSTRVTDAIAGSLTTSFSTYQAAADNTYVKVTAAEYAAVKANIAGAGTYGASDSRMSVFTPDDGWGAGYTIVSSASANNLTIPANTYLFAFSAKIMLSTAAIPANDGLIFKTTTANPPISGFSDWLPNPIVVDASLGNTTLYYVIKRPTNKTPATLPSFLAYYSPPRVKVSLNGIAGETGCYYAYNNVNTLGASLYSNSQPRIQTLGTTTKQW